MRNWITQWRSVQKSLYWYLGYILNSVKDEQYEDFTFFVRCWRTALKIPRWRWRSWRIYRSWKSWTSGRLGWTLREWLNSTENWRGQRRKGKKKRMSERPSEWGGSDWVSSLVSHSLLNGSPECVLYILREMLERVFVKRLRDTDDDGAEFSLPPKKSSADSRPTDILTTDKPAEGQVGATITSSWFKMNMWAGRLLTCRGLGREHRVLGWRRPSPRAGRGVWGHWAVEGLWGPWSYGRSRQQPAANLLRRLLQLPLHQQVRSRLLLVARLVRHLWGRPHVGVWIWSVWSWRFCVFQIRSHRLLTSADPQTHKTAHRLSACWGHIQTATANSNVLEAGDRCTGV